MKRSLSTALIGFLIAILILPSIGSAESALLSPEENLWLKSRNNTIVVYPEKNFPPYSYQNSSGTPQGLSIDYIELIAKKIGAKIEYLPGRPLSQIIDDVKQNKKGDVLTSLTNTPEREEFLYFTDTYLTVPAVIVVRKDFDARHDLTLNDLSGKSVAITSKHAVENFVRINNPRVVIESVVDDESGLQQLVLGEVDAAIMDITSLSYYISKQVLNSVKVVGNTGYEHNLAFAVPKDLEILQSILDKGLQQISANDRQILNDKWVVIPNQKDQANALLSYLYSNSSQVIIYILLCIIILIIVLQFRKRAGYGPIRFHRKENIAKVLEEEIEELENTSVGLAEELNNIKILEQDIKEKIKSIEK